MPALVREHCETLHQRLAESSASFIRMSNLTDVIASQQRLETIRNAHKRSIGYVNEPELRAMCGGSQTEWHRDLLVQIEIERNAIDSDAGSSPQDAV